MQERQDTVTRAYAKAGKPKMAGSLRRSLTINRQWVSRYRAKGKIGDWYASQRDGAMYAALSMDRHAFFSEKLVTPILREQLRTELGR